MGKRKREISTSSTQSRKRHAVRKLMRTCLSDGLTEDTIESFRTNRKQYLMLLNNHETNIKIESFKMSELNDDLLIALLPALRTTTTLNRLTLVQGFISDDGLKRFSEQLDQTNHIKHIDFRDNKITAKGFDSLIKLVSSSGVESLNLANNQITLQNFHPQSQFPTLQKLILDGNHQLHIENLTKAIELMPNLTFLSLVDCKLYCEQVTKLCESLTSHPSVSILHLSCNPIEEAGVRKIGELCQTNNVLKEVHIIGVTSNSTENILVEMLSQSRNAQLRVIPNRISDRAYSFRKMYPGKAELLSFLKGHQMEQYCELFFRLELTVNDLKLDRVMQFLQQFQLSYEEISILKAAICLDQTKSYVDNQTDAFDEWDVGNIKVLPRFVGSEKLFLAGIRDNVFPVTLLPYSIPKKDDVFLFQTKACLSKLFYLQHPNLLDFVGVHIPETQNDKKYDHIWLVFENVRSLSLTEWFWANRESLLRREDLDEMVLNILLGIARGLDYLSQYSTSKYTDFQLSQIGITATTSGNFVPKIRSKEPEKLQKQIRLKDSMQKLSLDEKTDQTCLNQPRWSPPENECSRMSFAWSFGILLWEFFELISSECQETQVVPFHTIELDKLVPAILNGAKLDQPFNCPDNIYSMILECTNPAAEKRPLLSDIILELISFAKTSSFGSQDPFSMNDEDGFYITGVYA